MDQQAGDGVDVRQFPEVDAEEHLVDPRLADVVLEIVEDLQNHLQDAEDTDAGDERGELPVFARSDPPFEIPRLCFEVADDRFEVLILAQAPPAPLDFGKDVGLGVVAKDVGVANLR